MAAAPFPSAVQSRDRCSGQQEITEGASLFSDVAAAKPTLMLRAAKVLFSGFSLPWWLGSWVAAS